MDLPQEVPTPRKPYEDASFEDMQVVVAQLHDDIVTFPPIENPRALTIRDMVERGLIDEDDFEQVSEHLSEGTIARIEQRYRTLMGTLENMRLQREMLQQQLGLLALRNERLMRDVMTDHLTGLGSRKALDARRDELEAQLSGERRRAGEAATVAVVVMSVDIVDLKGENAISQQAGDELIVRVAKSLATNFRQGDIFRRGGDEFIGLFPIRNEQEFSAIYENMCQLEAEDAGRRMRIGYSVAYAQGQDSIAQTEERADPKTHPESRLFTIDGAED